MAPSNLAQALLSQLAVRGFDPGDCVPVPPGHRVETASETGPVVTLVFDGVVARRSGDDGVSMGLAGPGEAVGFDIGAVGPAEGGLWLTSGRQLQIPLRQLAERLDATVLNEFQIADLHLKTIALRKEVLRHARLQISQRVAALLLEAHERCGATSIGLRQTDLAELLSVRRAGVSTACGELQGAVRVRRGVIELTDIDALRKAADPHSTVTDLARLRG